MQGKRGGVEDRKTDSQVHGTKQGLRELGSDWLHRAVIRRIYAQHALFIDDVWLNICKRSLSMSEGLIAEKQNWRSLPVALSHAFAKTNETKDSIE